MSEKQQFRLGLVGYGEIGSTLGKGLREAGLEQIFCYDKYAFDGPYAELIQSRAKEAGVTLVRSNKELADAAELIFSVTPGSASLESADAFAPVLDRRHTFLDFASATPKVKYGVAERLGKTGALLGDGSIMGTPMNGYSMLMLSSGAAGQRVVDLLVPWGMSIEYVGREARNSFGHQDPALRPDQGDRGADRRDGSRRPRLRAGRGRAGLRLQDPDPAVHGHGREPDALGRDPRQAAGGGGRDGRGGGRGCRDRADHDARPPQPGCAGRRAWA